MNVYQHFPGPLPGGDARNVNIQEITYRVDVPPSQLSNPWGLVGLNGTNTPTKGQASPYNPGVFADDFSVRAHGTQSLVTFRYSSNRQWRGANPPPDPTEPGFSSWSQSSAIAVVDIPMAEYLPEQVALPSSTVTQNRWKIRVDETEEPRTLTVWRGSLTTYSPASGEALINAQVNRIHQIPFPGGAKRLFLGADFNQATARWEATYQWEIDFGTPRPADWGISGAVVVVSGISTVFPPTVATVGGVPYVRLPFHRIRVKPTTDVTNIALPPTFYNVPFKAENLNGWTTLPGPIPTP